MNKQHKIKITLLEQILGTVPKNKEIYADFIQGRAKENGVELTDEEAQAEIETVQELEEKGWTGFHQLSDGTPILYDYVIKGFFKDACSALRRAKDTKSSKLTAYRKIIDGMVFVEPRQIILNMPEGKTLGILERPLRASTAQGERVTLTRSDTCPAGTILEFEITIVGGVVSDALLFEWLDYGHWKGLGQWRNAGYGKFEYEVLS